MPVLFKKSVTASFALTKASASPRRCSLSYAAWPATTSKSRAKHRNNARENDANFRIFVTLVPVRSSPQVKGIPN
jgi:hypothetical protein